jgi:pre-mRNA-splicing factor SYF1
MLREADRDRTEIFELFKQEIAGLPASKISDICVKYTNAEIKLNEFDRARAFFVHASQFCEPRSEEVCFSLAGDTILLLGLTLASLQGFWNAWSQFEISHGEADTFREMLRLKRSVQAQVNGSRQDGGHQVRQ